MKVLYSKSNNKKNSLKKEDKVKIISGFYKGKDAKVIKLDRKNGYALLDIVLKNSKQNDINLKVYYTNLEILQ